MRRLLIALAIAALSSSLSAQARDGTLSAGDGVELYYRVVGAGSDTIVVLHGGPGLNLGYLADDLAPLGRSHVVIFYDQRGAGRSTVVTDSTKINLSAHIADLEALRRHFALARMTVLGHSWGALLAARYALVHPERVSHLVLVDGAPPHYGEALAQFDKNLRGWMDSATTARLRVLRQARDTASDPNAACRAYWAVFIRGYFSDPNDMTTIRRMRGDVCTSPPAALKNSSRVNALTMRSLGEWDWRKDFAALHIPTLVIHGAKDPIPVEAGREWAAAIPGATLEVIEPAGHFPYVERPDKFFGDVNAFLRGGR